MSATPPFILGTESDQHSTLEHIRVRELRIFTLLVGSGLAAQGMMFVSSLIFSRIYPPTSFGELGYYTGFASLVAVVAGVRFDYLAFSSPREDRASYFGIAFLGAIGLHLFIFLVLSALQQTELAGTKTSYWLWFFSTAASLFYLGTQYLIADSAYAKFAQARMLQAILQLALGLILYLWCPDTGLLLSFSASQLLVGLYIVTRHGQDIRKTSRRQISERWNATARQAGHNSILTLLQYSTPFAPVLLGFVKFSVEELGAYFLFSSAIAAPFSIFRRSAINFLNGEAASPEKAHKIALALNRHRNAIGAVLLLGSIASVLLLSATAPAATHLIFGASWVVYSNFLPIVFLFHLLDALLQPFTTLLPLWGHRAIAMKLEVLRFILVFGLLPLIVAARSLNYFQALATYFFMMTAIYIASLIAVWHYTSLISQTPPSRR